MTQKNNNSLRQSADPYYDEEKKRYAHPLPSRQWIIDTLDEAGFPLTREQLVERLGVTCEEGEAFEWRLRAMVRDGEIYINRRGVICAADKIDLVRCRVEGHKDGYGFAVPLMPTDEGDFALTEKQMRTLMHGDIIAIRPSGYDRRGRREGRVLEVLKRGFSEVVARLYFEHGVALAIPDDRRLSQSILLPDAQKSDFNEGQVAVVVIDVYPTFHRPATGHIQEILGAYADPGMEIEIALRRHQLPYIFTEDCLKETAAIADQVSAKESKNRRDLRDLPLVTIDGADARDFDDAVFAEKKGRDYRLVVAIADVSHYVTVNSALDENARDRGTSVYFPRRVIPMLPEKLSNGICSLNPDVDRLTMVCDMHLSASGSLKDYEFYPALIRSHARFTYDEVHEALQTGAPIAHLASLKVLYALYQKLHKKRQSRGALEFDMEETQILFNEQGKIERIVPIQRHDVHRLIEECMLLANICAADFLSQNHHPLLYRVHQPPTPEKLAVLKEQLALLNLSLGGGEHPSPKDYARLFAEIGDRADKNNIQMMLLRSMQQAVYQPEKAGHFGLAYEAYTHFTSPIRRYPDLLVHRAIKAVLQQRQYHDNWQALGAHCSSTERRAEEASRDVEKWLKTYYMRDKIGAVFSARVSGMANFGLFVTLDNLYIEGMIHISDLGQDYFHYRPERLAIEGERSGVTFCMGDVVKVRVAQADLETCRVDLVLIAPPIVKKGKAATAAKRQQKPSKEGKSADKKTAKKNNQRDKNKSPKRRNKRRNHDE